MKNEKGLFVKNTEKWHVPRKLKKQIPKDTPYCYIPVEFPREENKWVYKIKLCPFHDYIKIKDMKPLPEYLTETNLIEFGEDSVGWCKLVKCEIDDQCKSCGLKYGY